MYDDRRECTKSDHHYFLLSFTPFLSASRYRSELNETVSRYHEPESSMFFYVIASITFLLVAIPGSYNPRKNSLIHFRTQRILVHQGVLPIRGKQ